MMREPQPESKPLIGSDALLHLQRLVLDRSEIIRPALAG
jgi:hypothetical protein